MRAAGVGAGALLTPRPAACAVATRRAAARTLVPSQTIGRPSMLIGGSAPHCLGVIAAFRSRRRACRSRAPRTAGVGAVSMMSATELAEAASVCQMVASLSVALCACVAAVKLSGAGSGAAASPPAAQPGVAADAMQTALAELSAQWLAQQSGGGAPADGAPQPAVRIDGAWNAAEGWESLSATHVTAQETDAGGSGGADAASRIWDAAAAALVSAQPPSAPLPSSQKAPPGARTAGRSSDAASDAQAQRERALPSLLLQALALRPREQLLQAALVALREHLPPAGAALPADAVAAWDSTGREAMSAAVLSAGRAWLGAQPLFVRELQPAPPSGDSSGGRAALLAALRDGLHPLALSGATDDARAISPASDANALAGPLSPSAPATPLLLSALESAAASVTDPRELGGRVPLYGALLKALAQRSGGGDEDGATGDDWGARGTLLGAAVLQDMAVVVAEAVAAAYVFWARGESAAERDTVNTPSGAPGLAGTLAARALLLPRLRATRALERFRNEAALAAWVRDQFESVREMYEDRQPLWGVGPRGRLLRRELPVSRRAELDALTGWRRTVSLLLEAADVVGPLLQRAGRRLGDALSFLLVRLIGRSLGLIARGVRQSVAPGAAV